jgi:hypothetical protein
MPPFTGPNALANVFGLLHQVSHAKNRSEMLAPLDRGRARWRIARGL